MNGGLHRNNLVAEEGNISSEIDMDESSAASSSAASSNNETDSNNGTDTSNISSLDIDMNLLGITSPGKSVLAGGEFSLRLPKLGDLHRTDSNASHSTNDSQYYHSVRSVESDVR